MTHPIPDADRIGLNALIDGEIDAPAAAALEARIATDPALQAAHEEMLATRAAVAAQPRPDVSPAFSARIESLVAPRAVPVGRKVGQWAGWQAIAASVVITAFVASGATYYLASPGAASMDLLIAAAHQRSLLSATPVDVLSSDRHTVKPWLDAHIGISPPAPDLAAQGYPLVGGRVDVLARQVVPTLVYRHNEHTISLMAVPGGTGDARPALSAAGGYNMAEWRADGFAFTAVSDLEPDELSAFAEDYIGAAK